MAKLKFEEALERLEQIVRQLEEGSLGLDESLKIFDEGIKLTQACTKKLEEAEKKIQILMKNGSGEKSLQPFGMPGTVLLAEETVLKNKPSLE